MRQDHASNTVRKHLGERVRDLREAQDLSQYTFCRMIAMDRSYLIGVEKGRRNISIDNLYKIARGLGVPLSTLFEGVDEFHYEHVSLPEE